MVETSMQGSLVQRMIRAARLEPSVYEEVESDQNATSQAAIVVAIVAVATGIGAGIGASMAGDAGNLITSVISGILSGLIGWVVWSYLTYFIGTRLFGGTATPGELLRCIGFAMSPGVLHLLAFLPGIGWLISLVVSIWTLVSGIVAVRQALDFDTGKAILTAIIGWVVILVITIVLASVFGLGAAMMPG
jgi:hypothetical protein